MLPENQSNRLDDCKIKKIVLAQMKKLAYIAADRGDFDCLPDSRFKALRDKRHS